MLGNGNGILEVSQGVFGDRSILGLAENDTNGGLIFCLPLLVVDRGQMKFIKPDCSGLKLPISS